MKSWWCFNPNNCSSYGNDIIINVKSLLVYFIIAEHIMRPPRNQEFMDILGPLQKGLISVIKVGNVS
jgi:hypothetical protein